MTMRRAFSGARIFDGAHWHEDMALLVEGVSVAGIGAPDAADAVTRLDGGMIVPGFIDLQVNGGGGALLNDVPTLEGIATILAAHQRFGTVGLLPTLITDTPQVTDKAIAAGRAAAAANLPGFLGLHLEGPHLSIVRKGAHDPALIRPMTDADIARLVEALEHLPNLLTTVAVESVTPEQIGRLVASGIVVSLGHTDASIVQVQAAAAAGASMVTHLFNAMSQMGNREPGVVGAVLDHPHLDAGIIADGIHVDRATMAIALRAKTGPARIFLVTDAMSLTGTDLQSFALNGRQIVRANGALRLADGTLAGADLTMIDAIAFVRDTLGLPLDEALRMAALYPAQAMDIAGRHGHLGSGAFASFVHLSDDLEVRSTWIEGQKVHGA